jgi:YjjG family noncanonical pyrimidine nucleotidase
MGRMVRAVLFDLDDTLFDHRHCARTALRRVHEGYACFACTPFDDFATSHGRTLEELHEQVLAGRLSIDDARRERFRRLFEAAGAARDAAAADRAARVYRQGYVESRRAIDGAEALLRRLKGSARIGIVSNNLLAEQRDKLRECGLEPFIDALVVSEEAGVSKPDPVIFGLALERLGCGPAEAVMIGDSWANDVVGAEAAGIRAIWFNPHGEPRPEDCPHVPELRALVPPGAVLDLLFARAADERRVAGRR